MAPNGLVRRKYLLAPQMTSRQCVLISMRCLASGDIVGSDRCEVSLFEGVGPKYILHLLIPRSCVVLGSSSSQIGASASSPCRSLCCSGVALSISIRSSSSSLGSSSKASASCRVSSQTDGTTRLICLFSCSDHDIPSSEQTRADPP